MKWRSKRRDRFGRPCRRNRQGECRKLWSVNETHGDRGKGVGARILISRSWDEVKCLVEPANWFELRFGYWIETYRAFSPLAGCGGKVMQEAGIAEDLLEKVSRNVMEVLKVYTWPHFVSLGATGGERHIGQFQYSRSPGEVGSKYGWQSRGSWRGIMTSAISIHWK